ncbi:MAG: AI-2E family transporter [Thermodesulfobacteriota bacterium]
MESTNPQNRMARLLRTWSERYLSDPQLFILLLLLALAAGLFYLLGGMLTPAIIALVIAYVLDGLVGLLLRLRMPRLLAVIIVFLLFLALVFTLIMVFLPMLLDQVGQLLQDLPKMVQNGQKALMALPERYPDIISKSQISKIMEIITVQLTELGQKVLAHSLSSVRGLITILVYLVLVPLLVFFFLKDKKMILEWMKRFLPEEHGLAASVWHEANAQVSNYVRGKIWEIAIVWAASFITFRFLHLRFSMLLAVMVGLSVIVPYIGATVVTFPVAMMAFFQWGLSPELLYVVIAYGILQFFDGNLLAPLLLAGVVHIHPVAVIVAILIFGGLWGIWGLFFAIPLATLVQAVLKAWADKRQEIQARGLNEKNPSA